MNPTLHSIPVHSRQGSHCAGYDYHFICPRCGVTFCRGCYKNIWASGVILCPGCGATISFATKSYDGALLGPLGTWGTEEIEHKSLLAKIHRQQKSR